jgi:hypothetical protein
MKKATTMRFDEDLLAALEAGARERGMSSSALVRTALSDFLKSDIRSSELAEFEVRMAKEFEKISTDILKLGNDVQLLIAIIDQLSQFVFHATPEILDRGSAEIVGKRRYENFISELSKNFSTREKRSTISAKIDSKDIG